MSKIKPLFGRVLLERPLERKSAGGIIIPDEAAMRQASLKAKVVAIGPTAEGVEVGQTVFIGRHAGAWLSEDGNPAQSADTADYYICQDEDILAVIEE